MTEEKETFDNEQNEDDLKEDNLNKDDESKPQNWLTENQFSMQIGIVLAAIAVFLVIIIGIFSGVSFFTMLWRVFAGGIIFFALGFGIGFLLNQFIPEIAAAKDSSEDNREYDVGNNVDFTIEDEDNTENNDDQKEFMDTFQDDAPMMNEPHHAPKNKFQEHNLPDDPKLLAEGVRTMMKKDE